MWTGPGKNQAVGPGGGTSSLLVTLPGNQLNSGRKSRWGVAGLRLVGCGGALLFPAVKWGDGTALWLF